MPNNRELPTVDARAAPPGVDAVEIKVTLGAGQVDAGLAAFALGSAAVERRQVWFCDRIDEHVRSDELPLLSRRIILRVRKRKDHADDATLKLRGPEGCIDPAQKTRPASCSNGWPRPRERNRQLGTGPRADPWQRRGTAPQVHRAT